MTVDGARLRLAGAEPQTFDERELLETYRDSCANDRVMLDGLLVAWRALSPAHRQVTYRVADALRSAAAWRSRDARA